VKYALVLLLGISLGLGGWGLYNLGGIDKASEIVYACRDYGKYVVSENWQITCAGPYNPIYLMPEYNHFERKKK